MVLVNIRWNINGPRKCEDPDFWRTVRDPSTGQDVILSKEDLQLIHRLREGNVPDPNHDEYQVQFFIYIYLYIFWMLDLA